MEECCDMHMQAEITAAYPVIGVAVPRATAATMAGLFDFEPVFEADWYVHLRRGTNGCQLGFVRFDHDSVPAAMRRDVEGAAAFVTLDADDVAEVWRVLERRLDVVLRLTDEPWGQRHFICRLPGGVMVDVVQMLPDAG